MIFCLPQHRHFYSWPRAVFTDDAVWYSAGVALKRRDLVTLAETTAHRFSDIIMGIKANATRCVVDMDSSLWTTDEAGEWRCFAPVCAQWRVTQTRVVYEAADDDRAIYEFDFRGTTRKIAHGFLIGASDLRVLYSDDMDRTWCNGVPSQDIVALFTDDSVLTQSDTVTMHWWADHVLPRHNMLDEPCRRVGGKLIITGSGNYCAGSVWGLSAGDAHVSGRYRVYYSNRSLLLECTSRSPERARRLIKDKTLAAQLAHFL